MSERTAKNWLITGSSRGLGREFAAAALARGDRVAVTARDPASLEPLVSEYGDLALPIRLDVSDRDACAAVVAAAHRDLGRLDVVVNNAGYGVFGAVEEASEEEVRRQFDTNFFGALWVSQAALPIMRAQGSGHLVQVSSVGGLVALPYVGLYNASKWALEAFSEAMAKEVERQGIRVTIVEPGPYATEWGPAAGVTTAREMPEYAFLREERAAREVAKGTPAAAGRAMLALVDLEEPPVRVFFGAHAREWVAGVYQRRLDDWTDWDDLAIAAHG